MLNDPIDGNGSTLLATTPAAATHALHRAGSRHSISLRHTLAVLFSRSRLILVVVVAIVLCSVLGVVSLPAHYRSEAKLILRPGDERAILDPTAHMGQAAVPMEDRVKKINSEIELLKSRKLSEAVVAKIGPNRILDRKPDAAMSDGDVASAIGKIEEKLTAQAIPDSDMLSISYDSSDPELSRDVVARVIDVYLDERSHVYRDQGDLTFFQGQLDNARRQQAGVQRKLRDLRDSSGVANPQQQRTLLVSRIDAIQHEVDATKADLDAAANAVGVRILHGNKDVANESAMKARIQSLEAAKLQAQAGLNWIDEIGIKTQALEQEQTLAEAMVSKYADACEQARIDEQKDHDRIGNISIAEPPVLPLRSNGPSRSLLLVAGMILAVSLGLGSALVANALDHTIHDAADLDSLGISQVISIPHVSDYSEPYYYALSPARRAAMAHAGGGGALDDDPADSLPTKPLRALIRSSANPAPNGVRTSASRNISDTDLRSGQMLIITDERGSELISVRQAGNGNRPAGQLAVSPRILAAIRGVVDRLMPLSSQQPAPRVIGVVGARNDEGASTVALHLAIALAHRVDTGVDDPSNSGRVLLLDSDLESPTSSLLAGAASARGLGDWVSMRKADTQPLTDLIMPTRQRLLDVLPAGTARERSPLSSRMPLVLRAVRPSYRHIVVDLPSVMDSDASAQMASLCDVVVFVCQANELRVEAAGQTLKHLRDAGAKIALAVLNKRRYPVPDWAYRMT